MRDSAALPLLIDVMDRAGHHDAPGCLRLLDQAEATLGSGRHKARPDIETARAAVAAGDWSLVWRSAWSATTGLTWAFPPDPGTCPPVPGPEPFGDAPAACDCGWQVVDGARFCPLCGARL